MLAGKARGKWQIDPILSIYTPPLDLGGELPPPQWREYGLSGYVTNFTTGSRSATTLAIGGRDAACKRYASPLFGNPYRTPWTHRVPNPPSNKKEIPKPPKSSRTPWSKPYFPQSKRYSPKVNVLSPKSTLSSQKQPLSIFRQFSANSDLPLPHGLAPFRDHGLRLNLPLSAVNPMHKGFSVSGAPFFGFGLADPAPKG